MRQQKGHGVKVPARGCICQWTHSFGVARIYVGAVINEERYDFHAAVPNRHLQGSGSGTACRIDVSAGADQCGSKLSVPHIDSKQEWSVGGTTDHTDLSVRVCMAGEQHPYGVNPVSLHRKEKRRAPPERYVRIKAAG